MPRTKGDDLAGPRHRVFRWLRAGGLDVAGPADDSELVPGGRLVDSAPDRRFRHRQEAADVERLPVAVLVDHRARPGNVGHRSDRVGRRRSGVRTRNVARMARRLRALRERRAALRTPRSAASRSSGTTRGNDRCRHRRSGRRHRISVYLLRDGPRVRVWKCRRCIAVADRLGAAAGTRASRHDCGHLCCTPLALARYVPASRAWRARRLRHPDPQQFRGRAGNLP